MDRSLKDLKPGEFGTITLIKGKGPFKRRLMDMGVVRGTNIFMEKEAPLGDPIEIKVKGYSLALRKCDAENILVK